MHPGIAAWPSQGFYDGKLQTVFDTASYRPPAPLRRPAQFVHVEGQDRMVGPSRVHPREAEVLVDLVKRLVKNGTCTAGIGVITMYRAQVALVKRLLAESGTPALSVESVEVNTVDAYQGREKDVILVSTVRVGYLGFVADDRRMNVALTRGKRGLVVVGNRGTLQQDRTWASWLQAVHSQ